MPTPRNNHINNTIYNTKRRGKTATSNNRILLLPATLGLFLLLLAGCVHKPDIQQGNVITQEMVDQLQIGMKQNQVKGIIGKPLITDPFRNDRWDYVYSMVYDNRNKSQYSYITLYFDKDKLSEIKIHKQPLKEEEIQSIEMKTKKTL